ncbi:MAG: hypothetical protein ACKVH0_18320, partial [Alphaproteobacteria bacterium]
LLKLGPAAAVLLLTAVIIAFVVGASVLTLPSFQGSIMYAPALISLAGLTAALAVLRRPAWKAMAVATTTLALSLTLRSYDNAICADFPTGTHFVWHLLNGLLFALLLRAIIVHGTAPAAKPEVPADKRRIRLWIEFCLIYLAAPVATTAMVMTGDLSTRHLPLGLVALLILALVLLFLTPGVSWRRAFGGRLIADWRALLLFTVITLAAIYGLVMLLTPHSLFGFPNRAPDTWTIVMILYPILSVLPQGVIYRVLFFERYGVLFPNVWSAIVASALMVIA